mmetsp:Transcript_68054/g.146776  ORF Transcript_68054/g.146776 Transcript_68054/m.146776 type:complete len:470 (-) Transcript_68054:203-1612(-)
MRNHTQMAAAALRIDIRCLLVLSRARHNIVNSENQASALNCRLQRLGFHAVRLPNAQLVHIGHLAGGSIHTPRVLTSVVFYANIGQKSNDVSAAILRQGTGNHLQCGGNGLVRESLDTLYFRSRLHQSACNRHLSGTTSRDQAGVENTVPNNLHGVLKIPLDLVQHILGSTTQQYGARLGLFALLKEHKILVTNLAHFEEPTARSDIGLLDLVGSVDDGGAGGTRHAVVVGLPQSTEGSDVRLQQIVLGKVRHALLGDHNVWLEGHNLGAQLLDVLLLLAQQCVEVVLVHDFHVGLALSLLVLKGAVQQQDPRVLDAAPHLGVRDVLVEHDAVQHGAVRQGPAGDLLDADVPLDVDLRVLGAADDDLQHGIDGHGHEHVSPARGELGADGGIDQLGELCPVVDLHSLGNGLQRVQGLLQGLAVAAHDDGGVKVALQQGLGHRQDLTAEDDDRGGAVADLLVLRAGELDH